MILSLHLALGVLVAVAFLTMAVLELGAALRALEDGRDAVMARALGCAALAAAVGFSIWQACAPQVAVVL